MTRRRDEQRQSTSMLPQPAKGIGSWAFMRNWPCVSGSVSRRCQRSFSAALRARAFPSAPGEMGRAAAKTNRSASDESTPLRQRRRTLSANVSRQLPGRTIPALYLRLTADAPHPFHRAGRLIPAPPRLFALEPPRPHILPTTEKAPEQPNLRHRHRMLVD